MSGCLKDIQWLQMREFWYLEKPEISTRGKEQDTLVNKTGIAEGRDAKMKMNKIVKSMCTLMLTGAMLAGSAAEAFLAAELPEEVYGETAPELSLEEIAAEPAAEANEEAAEPASLVEADALDVSFEFEEDAAALDPTDPAVPMDPADPENAAQEEEIVYDDLEDVITEDLIWSEDEMEEEALPAADGTEEEFQAAEGEDASAEEEELPSEQLEETAEEPGPQEAAAPSSGECGDCNWTLSGSTLTITPKFGKVGSAKVLYGFKDLQDSESSFPNVISVKKIVLEDGIKEIGYNAFVRFINLETVSFQTSDIVRIGTGAFTVCESLENIDIPQSVTQIDDGAFSGCKKLTSILLPNNLTSLGLYKEKAGADLFTGAGYADNSGDSRGVFNGCSALTKITVPTKVTQIGGKLFFGCSKLDTVTMKGVSVIPKDTFNGCASLKKLEMTSITSIGQTAFKDCEKLEEGPFILVENVSTGAFEGCISLKRFSSASKKLTLIGYDAFYGCSALETVDLSYSGVTTIDGRAFTLCTSLKSVLLPSTISGLRKSAFDRCTALESINLNNVVNIWEYAFNGCSALKDIKLSDKIGTIDTTAFTGTSSSKVVTYDGSEEDFNSIPNISSNTGLTNGTIKYLKKNDTRPKLSDLEPTILSTKNTDDIKDAAFNVLQARMKTRGKTSIKLTWEKVEGANGYVVYGALRKKAYERLVYVEETKNSYKIKGLKADKYYKFVVVAYADSGNARRVRRTLSVSSVIIAATKGGKYRNTDSVTIKEAPKQTLKAKKKLKLTVTEVSKPKNGKKYMTYRKLTLESSDPTVAKILKSGKIKALKKGKCYIYAYSQNGAFAKIQIKVKAA